LAQKIIQRYLSSFPEFALAGTCENALKGFEQITITKVDLLFLDITLPLVNGIDFVRSLRKPPAIIFTTAYADYAATSYELEAVDYLVKPITFERFTQAINRYLRLQEKEPTPEEKDFLFIKESGKLVKVFFAEILFIEARKDYLLVQTAQRRYLTHFTMKAMEEELPADRFIRIHRSYIVSIKAVERIATTFLEIKGNQLPIGEIYKQKLPKEFRRRSL
jgi:two-component system LytT family response regulator